MKFKIILFLAVAAILTLSFTFVSVTSNRQEELTTNKTVVSEPTGGFVIEDKF